jgi:hypothetical protein
MTGAGAGGGSGVGGSGSSSTRGARLYGFSSSPKMSNPSAARSVKRWSSRRFRIAGLTLLKISASGTSTSLLSCGLIEEKVPGGAWRTTLASDILTEPVGRNRRMAGIGMTTIACSGGILVTSFRRSSGNFDMIASNCSWAVSTLCTPVTPSTARGWTPGAIARTGTAVARGTGTAIGEEDFLLRRLRRNRNMQPGKWSKNARSSDNATSLGEDAIHPVLRPNFKHCLTGVSRA